MTRIIFTLWDQHIRLVISSFFFLKACKKNSSVFFPFYPSLTDPLSILFHFPKHIKSLGERLFLQTVCFFFFCYPFFGIIIIIIINDFKLQTKNIRLIININGLFVRKIPGVSNNTNKHWRRAMLIWGPRCQFIPPKSHAKVSR